MTVAEIENAYHTLKEEIHKVIIGQDEIIDGVLIALFTEGHVLLEGFPGLGKTLLVMVLSHLIRCDFKRIQFTPDLMPSDIIGTNIFNMQSNAFSFSSGPVFTNILLSDEINRSPAKTQAALLEAMQERQVSVDGYVHTLPRPFINLATQNPIELEGTYPLPEAQTDRFMFKLLMDYPSLEEEKQILRNYNTGFDPTRLDQYNLNPVENIQLILDIQAAVKTVNVEEKVMDYITNVVHSTRTWRGINVGASPRASVNLFLASRTTAAIRGRDFVIPDDIKYLAHYVLRHRIILDPDLEIEGVTTDNVIDQILDTLEVPR